MNMKQRALQFTLASMVSLASFGAHAQDKAVTLRFSHFLPPTHPLQVSFQEWKQSVETASRGSIKIDIFPAQQLGKAFDHYDMARDGIVDVAFVGPGYQPGRFPISDAVGFPFLTKDAKKGTLAVDSWYRKYAPSEMKDAYYCLGFLQEPGTLHSRKKVVVPADLAGLKVRPPNAVFGRLIVGAGGTNVSAAPQETRELIERGVIDATLMPWGSAVLFGLDKVAKHHLDAKLYGFFSVLTVNKPKYSGLSAEQKKVIDNHCTPEWAEKIAAPFADFEAAGLAKLAADSGQEILKLTPAQLLEWQKTVDPLWVSWAESVRKTGGDPEGIRSELMKSLSAYGAEN